MSLAGTRIALLLAAAPVFQQAGAQTPEPENIVLGRPPADSITVHALADEATVVFVEYGEQPGVYSSRSPAVEANIDDVAEVTVGGLRPNTRYFYRVNYRGASDSGYRAGREYSFHTQRSRGSTFTFGVQGDSHPERSRDRSTRGAGMGAGMGVGMYHPDLYVHTMEQVASARPDLYFMLGDDFNISEFINRRYFQGDKSVLTQQIVDDVYLGQRDILRLMTHSTALFPVIGNHEEARGNLLGTKLYDAVIYAGRSRVRMLPVPAPDSFYSGNPERAHLYEWGGHGESGEWEFDERRPDWELPVHQLMVRHGVTIFFQGHDHLVAHQELDGIVYQTVPNPADENYRGRSKEYYLSGTILDNSRYLDVTVSPDEVEVNYVRSYLPQDETDDRRQGDVDYSYTIN